MKQIKRILMSAALIALCVTLSSCNNAFHDATGATSSEGGGNSGSPPSGGNPPPPYVFTTPAIYREMVSLDGATITGSGSTGAFRSGRDVTLSAFKIATYETTYELWKEVRDWAATKGYTIVNEGYEGHQAAGTAPGTGTTNETHGWTEEEKKIRPVTYINWRDAIVWCNAYSELDGRPPVYYTEGTYGTVLKKSTNDDGTATAADSAVMKPGANGYRLPTEAEWEYAARGGNTSDGAWSYTYAGTNTAGTNPGELGDYAWYDVNSSNLGNTHKNYGPHPVGTKAANGANLYDMSGNVHEWCWGWYDTITTGTVTDPAGAASGSFRMRRGGSWTLNDARCTVAYRSGATPEGQFIYLGFRVVCRP